MTTIQVSINACFNTLIQSVHGDMCGIQSHRFPQSILSGEKQISRMRLRYTNF
ncbi:hypothetical protein CROQUDRAFT_656636 [Cronartium quercuum f. sp. fusiforme G11]|uniref:Uncharacterized protein n=1 Tax=Cronartium quercuum f. sp. fusiforme G11 TaxID=708437 RepID=A0A9P6NNZ0_9BASI|nr:hypothetical protein CROQUDRAFT_656636 [Cronartium quercuum f. sp. fusiforme G11]